ncbi:MAG TPA: peptidyl-prolyl cis-trans isomerase [Gemmataceae bacterium]|nr:peptidyl-prolyl cis-trans isomerase [Gemmataceae bacterium]
MNWHRLLASIGIVMSTVGCATGPTELAAGEPESPMPQVARLQKPDAVVAAAPGPITPVRATNSDSATPTKGDLSVRVRAQVNGVAILDSEVRDAAFRELVKTLQYDEPERTALQKTVVERVLQQIIDREVLLADMFARLQKGRPQALEKLKEAAAKEFEKQIRGWKVNVSKAIGKPASDEDLKDFFRTQGLSLEGMRRQHERDFMATEYLRNVIWPKIEHIGHEQIREYYEAHPDQFQIEDRVEWQDIFIDAGRYPSREAARQAAEDVAARARRGEDFAALAAMFDKESYALNKGAGLGQQRGKIQPSEAESILFQLRDGQVGPIIELGTGFHVIRLVKRDYAGLVPFNEKTQGEIRRKVQMLVMERESKRLVADLKRKATIEYDPRP